MESKNDEFELFMVMGVVAIFFIMLLIIIELFKLIGYTAGF